MPTYKLHIIKQGQTQVIPLNAKQTLRLAIDPKAKYQIVDQTDQVVKNLKAELVDGELVLLEGEQPLVALENYSSHFPASSSAQMLDAVMLGGGEAASSLASQVSSAQILGWGAAIVGTAGVAVAAGGGGGKKGGGENNSSSPQPKAPEKVVPTLQFDPITEDNIINLKESGQKITVTGSVNGVESGDAVVLKIGEASVMATVDGSRFSAQVDGVALAAHQEIRAEVIQQNQKVTEGSHRYTVDTEIAKPTITLDAVTGDDVVSVEEASKPITITGTVANISEGSVAVKVFCGCPACQRWVEKTATVKDGQFSVELDSGTLNPGTNTIRAIVRVEDAAKNSAETEVVRHYEFDNTPPQATISLDNVDSNNVINSKTAAQVTLTGAIKPLQAGESATVVLQIGDKTHQVAVVDNRFSLSLAKTDFAAHSQVKAVLTVREASGNQVQHEVSQDYVYDVAITQPTVTLDAINQGQVFNQAHKEQGLKLSGQLTYDNDIAVENVKVIVRLNNVDYQATVEGKTWQLHLTGEQAAAYQGNNDVRVEVQVADRAGNEATATTQGQYQVDTVAPMLNLVINNVTADNTIDKSEKSQQVTISGKVEGAEQHNVVTLMIGEQAYSAQLQQNGDFSLTVSGEVLAKVDNQTITAHFADRDSAGNQTEMSAHKTYQVNLVDERPFAITLNHITDDNRINVSEASQTVEVAGQVSGTGAVVGQQVTLTVNGQTYTTTVDERLQFRFANVKGADLANDADRVLEVAANNQTIHHHYQVQDSAQAQIVFDPLSHIEAESVFTTVEGIVELPQRLTAGHNRHALHSVKLIVGEHKYQVALDQASYVEPVYDGKTRISKGTMSFKWAIPKADLVDLVGKPIKYQFEGDNVIYTLRHHDNGRTTVDARYTSYEFNLIDMKLASDHVQDNKLLDSLVQESTTAVTGSVIGGKVGDTVKLAIGSHQLETKVGEGQKFSVDVANKHLAQANKIDATLVTTDASNKAITANTEMSYSVAPEVSGKFVAKTPYFEYGKLDTEMPSHLRAMFAGYFFETVAPFNSEEVPTITYRIQPGAGRSNYKDFSQSGKELIRKAFADYEEVIKLKFQEADENSNHTVNIEVSYKEIPEAAGLGSYGGNIWISWNIPHFENGRGYGTIVHEIGHALGMKHSFGDFALSPQEENQRGSVMSYTHIQDVDGLQLFDLAYLHYRYGVNPNGRSGNDVYKFKTVNPSRGDYDIYIWDGAGVDTFDASDQTQSVYVNLTPGSWIYSGQKSDRLLVEELTMFDHYNYFPEHKGQIWGRNYLPDYKFTYTKGQAMIGYGTQIEKLIGSDHDDTLIGNKADNVIYGGKGKDSIDGGEGNDYLDGGLGVDTLTGGLGDDIFVVDESSDVVKELADQGTDTIHSYAESYIVPDYVEKLQLFGTAKNATGNALANELIGNNQNNTLNGGEGDDRLDGKQGSDTLTGGSGADVFIFSSLLDGSVDNITDFNVAEGDKIQLSQAVFNALTKESNVLDFIKYDKNSGHLSYDPDAEGMADSIQFATLSPSLELTADQFIIS